MGEQRHESRVVCNGSKGGHGGKGDRLFFALEVMVLRVQLVSLVYTTAYLSLIGILRLSCVPLMLPDISVVELQYVDSTSAVAGPKRDFSGG